MRFTPTLWYSSAFWGLVNISAGSTMFVGAYQLETVARWQAYTPWNTLGCVLLCLFGVFFVFRGVADIFSLGEQVKKLSKKAEAARLAIKSRRAELLELFNKYEGTYTKLEMEPDESRYDDSYIDTWKMSDKMKEEARKELWDLIEREGVWVVVSYYWDFAQECWEVGGSVGACVANGEPYEEDLKIEAAMCLQACFQDQANELAKRATYAAG